MVAAIEQVVLVEVVQALHLRLLELEVHKGRHCRRLNVHAIQLLLQLGLLGLLLQDDLPVTTISSHRQLQLLLLDFFLQLIHLVKVRQFVLEVANHTHLVDRSEGSKEPYQILFMNVLFRKTSNLHTKLFWFDVLVVFFLQTDGPEEVDFPQNVEDEEGQEAGSRSEAYDVAI